MSAGQIIPAAFYPRRCRKTDILNLFFAGLAKPVFVLMAVLALGYLLGSVRIKGLSLGSAGVLIAALLCGLASSGGLFPELGSESARGVWSFLSSMGTALFITAVGLTAGPGFFRNLGRGSLKVFVLGVLIVASGCTLLVLISRLDARVDASLGLGLMTGAMTSTPGFSSAAESPLLSAPALAAGYGIAYIFGIFSKVLFMQLAPRFSGADMNAEREKFFAANAAPIPEINRQLRAPDKKGFCAFALTAALGLALGSLSLPGGFSLGASGGTLISGLVVGHFRHVGGLDLRVPKSSLDFFREMGLVLFLVGAGIPGGISFAQHVRPVYFLYGAIMSLVPMFIGYLAARRILGMDLLQALGSIAGGCTSTPALGALISACGTDSVVSAYAAAYPVALVCMVFAAKLLPVLL